MKAVASSFICLLHNLRKILRWVRQFLLKILHGVCLTETSLYLNQRLNSEEDKLNILASLAKFVWEALKRSQFCVSGLLQTRAAKSSILIELTNNLQVEFSDFYQVYAKFK